MANLSKLSYDELIQKRLDVDARMQELREQKKEISDEIDRRAVESKLEGLTDSEKAHLAQILKAEGIESEEAVNGV